MRDSLVPHLVAVVATVVLIVLPVYLLAAEHLGSPKLWFDESGQVFLSLGQHHYLPPHAPDGGFAKILEYGRYMNSDPGGFTVLLRLWLALFGTSPAAVRSLAFVFFLLAPVIIFLSARRLGTDPVTAVLAASVPVGFPMLLQYATEVRAYSMETCAVVFLFFLPCWLSDRMSGWMVAGVGCIGALLATSRYSAFIAGAAACAVALLPLRPSRTAFLRMVRLAVPFAIVAIASYLAFARFQITGGGRLPAVFEPFMLIGKDFPARMALLRENFLTPGALPIPIFFVFAPLFALAGPRSLQPIRALVGKGFTFSALYVALLAIGSATGRLPWAWATRWSIGYQTLSACCLAMIVIAAGSFLVLNASTRQGKALMIAAMACFTAVWSIQVRRAVRSEHPYYETIASQLQDLAGSPGARSLRFFVQINATPTTRYLVEYGPLRGAFNYPKNFHFESPAEAEGKLSIPAEQFDVVVLTHFQFTDAYRARVTGGTTRVVTAPSPSCLLVVNR